MKLLLNETERGSPRNLPCFAGCAVQRFLLPLLCGWSSSSAVDELTANCRPCSGLASSSIISHVMASSVEGSAAACDSSNSKSKYECCCCWLRHTTHHPQRRCQQQHCHATPRHARRKRTPCAHLPLEVDSCCHPLLSPPPPGPRDGVAGGHSELLARSHPPLESLLLPRSRSIALTTHCPTIMTPANAIFRLLNIIQQELAGIL